MTTQQSYETPEIEILLATYNGARFLREQIESIRAQEHVSVKIFARDDGSTDNTVSILEEYAARYPESFTLIHDGIRTGCARDNFGRLMQFATAQYVAFADQDDIWLPDKLHVSMQAMHGLESRHGTEKPLLVYTDLRVVDQQLHTLHESLWHSNGLWNAQKPTLAKMLSENVVTGCTVVMNRALVQLVQPMPAVWTIHDHWVALIAVSMGAMMAVPQATILYRQHDSNETGAIMETRTFRMKMDRFLSDEGRAARRKQYAKGRAQAQSLLALHGNAMPKESRTIISDFIAMATMSPWQRLRTTFRHKMWRVDPQRRLAQFIDVVRGE